MASTREQAAGSSARPRAIYHLSLAIVQGRRRSLHHASANWRVAEATGFA
ncbi:MAG: hypothetical protein IT467_03025 [Dokdonella sp.]|nr:hypothetical protein [Dokdonella sp.]